MTKQEAGQQQQTIDAELQAMLQDADQEQDKFYNDRNRKHPRRKHVLPSDVGEIAPG